jgi:hypothetical protein
MSERHRYREEHDMTNANQAELDATLVARHAEAHDLLTQIAAQVDGINPDTATWGNVGDLGCIIEQLRNAVGLEG